MDTIALWENLQDLKIIESPVSVQIQTFSLSNDWYSVYSTKSLFTKKLKNLSQIPQNLFFDQVIIEISCNSSMSLFLTMSKQVFGVGNDIQRAGLFGKADFFFSESAFLIEFSKEVPVVSVSLAETHAGAISREGLLYTWGSVDNGELGDLLINESKPSLVNSSCIFKSTKVVCGQLFTAICTEAGFLYIYRKPKKCSKCSENSAYPFNPVDLQDHFILNLYPFFERIVALSDDGKCFVINSCFCIDFLDTNENISDIATCKNGIVGLCYDQSVVYSWKQNESSWDCQLFSLKNVENCKIYSGLSNSIAMIGENLNQGSLKFIMKEKKTPRLSLQSQERKSFEEILTSYGLKPEPRSLNSDIVYKNIQKCINNFKSRIFKQIHMFSYVKYIYNKTYKSTLTPIAILKTLQRIILIQKSYAFRLIQNCFRSKICTLIRTFVKIQRKVIRKYFFIWKSAKKNKISRFEEKLKVIGTKKIFVILEKISRKNRKFFFKNSRCFLDCLVNTESRFTSKKSKSLLKIVLIYNKLQCKFSYSILSRRFKKLVLNLGEKSFSQKHSLIFIDPKYKIEIIPPAERNDDDLELSTPLIKSQSFNSETSEISRSQDSLKLINESHDSVLISNSPSVDSASPSSEPSPIINRYKDTGSFKNQLFRKTDKKNKTEVKSPPLNLTERKNKQVSFTTKLQNTKKVQINTKINPQKSSIIKEPSTPPIFNNNKLKIDTFQRRHSQVGSESINLSIPSKTKTQFIQAIFKVYANRLSQSLKEITTFMENKVNPNSPSNNEESINKSFIKDSWKLKLYSLGINKFSKHIRGVQKKNMYFGLKCLKSRSI